MTMAPSVVSRKVVIDAGAAIKLQRLDRFGGELYSTSGVLREVRDEKARALLRTLPEEIRARDPVPDDIAFVKQFAKLTGDLGFLSQNDIELIALTVALQREAGGPVRERPNTFNTSDAAIAFDWAPSKAQAAGASPVAAPEPAAVASAAAPEAASAATPTEDKANDSEGEWVAATNVHRRGAKPRAEKNVVAEAKDNDSEDEWVTAKDLHRHDGKTAAEESVVAEAVTGETAPDSAQAQELDAAEGEDEDIDDDSEDGSSAGEWVTQENVHRFGMKVQESGDIRVTCATSDYSVQNVLLQMGITPLTFDGYAVQSVKLWGLVCRACFFFTRDTEKVFCPKCGHDTVVRVPIVVGQDGTPTVVNSGRPLRKKGTIYSCPKPQGGRCWKPVFAEDEMKIGGRDRELRHTQNLADKDRKARDPFDEDNGARPWHQRSGQGGRGAGRVNAGYGRQNPNAGNFKGFAGGRKKR